MTIQLRPHQEKLIEGIQLNWRRKIKRILAFLCTRGGKTYCFIYLAKKTNENGKKVLILTNRKKLFTQTGNAIADFGIHPAYINDKTKRIRTDAMTYIAMVQTLIRRLEKPETIKFLESINLIVADECHISEFDKILNHPVMKGKYILGVTGSPSRQGQQPELSETYQQIVIGSYTADLEPIYCVPAKVYEVPVDMSGVSKNPDGEFNNYETFQRFDSPKLYQGAVNNWLKYANGLVTLCYCVSILHAAKTCVQFNESGIKCKFISSGKAKPKLPDNPNKGAITKHRIALEEYEYIQKYQHLTGDPETIIQEWERGDFTILVNCDMLTFGYDNNRIDCILINRATNSVPLWLQMANRGGTPRAGKDRFILLDMGGNSERLKDYNYRHEWSLFHKKPSKGGGIPSTKECDKCHALVIASARVCDWCGYEFPKSKQQEEVDLVERRINEICYKNAASELDTIEKIETFAKAKGHSKLWIFRSIYFKLGEDEFKMYMRNKKYHWGYIYRLIDSYAV